MTLFHSHPNGLRECLVYSLLNHLFILHSSPKTPENPIFSRGKERGGARRWLCQVNTFSENTKTVTAELNRAVLGVF